MKSIDLPKMKKKLLKALDREGGRLQARLSEITSMKNALSGIGGGEPAIGNGRRKKRHTMSAAGRRAVARAQKARWRAKKAEK